IYLVSYIFWYSLLPEKHLANLNQVHALIGILAMAGLGIAVGRKGNGLGYYFALAYLLFFIIASIEVSYIATGSPAYILEISYVSIGILVEVFIIAILLTKRFEWDKRDSDQAKIMAQNQLLEKTLENENFVKSQNQRLEQMVVERTNELSASLE